MRTLGIITARGGSKGIEKKNLVLLAGKPLIAYTIEQTKQARKLDRCIVSTDDDEIATVCKSLSAEVPFMRPKELARDTSTSIEVVQHAIQWFKEHEHESYDYVMILQPTSPLRSAHDIDASIEKAYETDADSVMGMVEVPDFSAKKLKMIKDDAIVPFGEDEGPQSDTRHAANKVYKRNAAIYLTKTEWLLKGNLFGEVSRPYIMPRKRSVDVNDAFDLAIAGYLLSKR